MGEDGLDFDPLSYRPSRQQSPPWHGEKDYEMLFVKKATMLVKFYYNWLP